MCLALWKMQIKQNWLHRTKDNKKEKSCSDFANVWVRTLKVIYLKVIFGLEKLKKMAKKKVIKLETWNWVGIRRKYNASCDKNYRPIQRSQRSQWPGEGLGAASGALFLTLVFISKKWRKKLMLHIIGKLRTRACLFVQSALTLLK